jgi:carbonic anhydrase
MLAIPITKTNNKTPCRIAESLVLAPELIFAEVLTITADKVDKLVEVNVIEQCQDLIKTSIVQKAWANRKAPEIHGWVYGLKDGLVKELVTIKPDFDNISPIFRYDMDQLKES